MARFLFVFSLCLAACALFAAPASAQCPAPPFGDSAELINVDNETRGVTRIRLDHVCEDGGRTGYEVQLWGACTSGDCRFPDGFAERSRGNGPYTAKIEQSYAVRTLRFRPFGDYMLLILRTDFTAPEREDYVSRYVMMR